jgi:hypothetical protein
MTTTPNDQKDSYDHDGRRDPTPDEAYRLSYNIGADGSNMSRAEYEQLVREVKWPAVAAARSANDSRPAGAAKAASPQAHLAVPTATGLEAILKELFPILRPIPFKVLVGGVVAIVGIVSVLVIVGAVTNSGGIQAGDCVTTWTNPLNGNDHIDKSSCSGGNAKKVLAVQDTPDGSCDPFSGADITFQDQVTGQTYCLGPDVGAGQP